MSKHSALTAQAGGVTVFSIVHFREEKFIHNRVENLE